MGANSITRGLFHMKNIFSLYDGSWMEGMVELPSYISINFHKGSKKNMADRTATWRILFEGFSCAGEDRKALPQLETKDIDVSEKQQQQQQQTVLGEDDLPPFQKLSFLPEIDNSKMWISSPSKRLEPTHAVNLMADRIHATAHFMSATTPPDLSRLRLQESVILGSRSLSGTSTDIYRYGSNARQSTSKSCLFICTALP